MSESTAFKELLFKRKDITAFADSILKTHPSFDREAFVSRVFDETWNSLELKARMRHITLALGATLPDDYREAVKILLEATPTGASESFVPIVACDYVEVHGMDDWKISIHALEILTQRGTAEGAIRPFLLADMERGMKQMLAWADHENEHVRRLASEGCRPRLPWNIALNPLKEAPSPILPILEKLRDDPSEYVRRSVANNLNDIAKDNPDVVIETVRRWSEDASENVQWVIRHGLRSLIKAGNSDALEVLGYSANPGVEVTDLSVTPEKVHIGGQIAIRFTIRSMSSEAQHLMIDYVLHSVKANGKRTSKVWKLKKAVIKAGETLVIHKKHSFKPVTTRTLYGGEHLVEPQINGTIFDGATFELMV